MVALLVATLLFQTSVRKSPSHTNGFVHCIIVDVDFTGRNERGSNFHLGTTGRLEQQAYNLISWFARDSLKPIELGEVFRTANRLLKYGGAERD